MGISAIEKLFYYYYYYMSIKCWQFAVLPDDTPAICQEVVGLNLVLSDKVFFSVDSGSLGHG